VSLRLASTILPVGDAAARLSASVSAVPSDAPFAGTSQGASIRLSSPRTRRGSIPRARASASLRRRSASADSYCSSARRWMPQRWQTQILTRLLIPVCSTGSPGFTPRFRLLFMASCIGAPQCGQAPGGASSVTLRGYRGRGTASSTPRSWRCFARGLQVVRADTGRGRTPARRASRYSQARRIWQT